MGKSVANSEMLAGNHTANLEGYTPDPPYNRPVRLMKSLQDYPEEMQLNTARVAHGGSEGRVIYFA